MRSGNSQSSLSDFRRVISTIFRKTIPQGNPKTIFYRNYNSFDQKKFSEDMNSKVKKMKNCDFAIFQDILLSVLGYIN